jgi:iron complex outermembrane receptor protein
LRYQRDRQVRQGALIGGRRNLPLAYDRTFSAWLPKFSLALDVSTDVRIGALAQRASNPGGVNLNTVRSRSETFEAEHLWDFEVFTRARLAGGNVTLTANLFRYEMTDAQRTETQLVGQANGQPILDTSVGNARRAWSKGLELELDWRPSRHFTFRGAIGLLDTRITKSADRELEGKQFQRSPRFSGSASIVWMPVDNLSISAQARRNSRYFSDDKETSTRMIPGSSTVDMRAAWSTKQLSLFAYVRNLFDEFHLTYLFSTGLATAGDPREAGFGIEAKF